MLEHSVIAQKQQGLTSGDNCIETIPPGIDASACEESPAPGQSGVTVFFCDTTVVIICADENEDEGEEENP